MFAEINHFKLPGRGFESFQLRQTPNYGVSGSAPIKTSVWNGQGRKDTRPDRRHRSSIPGLTRGRFPRRQLALGALRSEHQACEATDSIGPPYDDSGDVDGGLEVVASLS